MKPSPEKKVYAKGRFNTVYIVEHYNGSVTLTDDFGESVTNLDAEYLKSVGNSVADAIRWEAAQFDNMEYLYPVEDYNADGLYGA